MVNITFFHLHKETMSRLDNQSLQQPVRSPEPEPGDFFLSFLDNALPFVVLRFFTLTLRSFSNPETPAESPMAATGARTMADGVPRSTVWQSGTATQDYKIILIFFFLPWKCKSWFSAAFLPSSTGLEEALTKYRRQEYSMCSGATAQPSHKELMVNDWSQFTRSPWHWAQNTDAFLHRKYHNNLQNPSTNERSILSLL